MKRKTIGIFGAAINNPNLGCIALTYSLIQNLEIIARRTDECYVYYVFEGKVDENKRRHLCTQLNIPHDKVVCYPCYFQYGLKSGLYHMLESISAVEAMKKCDFFIDLTNGDSFTDIYGKGRFDGATRIKEFILKNRWPLILGPQTYGPFNDSRNQNKAKTVIDNATCVIARDQASADYIHSFSNKNVHVTTDLAFGLPFTKKDKPSEKVCVGVNISSLLLTNKTESTQRNFKINTDYDLFTKQVLDYLSARDGVYEIFVIPHVGTDGGVQFKEDYPNINFLDPFEDPISAKSFISSMDVFIGARMHSTIGAFSSGVATIPIAYSRKFSGLYSTLQHKYVVDLQSLSTDEAVQTTIKYIEDWKTIKESEKVGKLIYQQNNKNNIDILMEAIRRI